MRRFSSSPMAPLPIVTPEAQLPITPEILASRRAELHRDIEEQLARVGPPPEVKLLRPSRDSCECGFPR
jgi:hypothetical protein